MPRKTDAIQDAYLGELIRGNAEVIERGVELQDALTDEQLAWLPPDGGWSAGQALEHLVISGRLYVDRIDAIIDRARTQGRSAQREWKPSLMGGMIMRAVKPTSLKRYKTQKVFTPGPAARHGVLKEFVKMHRKLDEQMRKADGLDLRAVKITSPVTALIRMNLGDAFGILVFHSQRHLLQAGRVITSPGFPKSK